VTQSSMTGPVELVRLSTGAGFGELALMSNEPRKASVGAVDKVVCLKLDVVSFNLLLGNIEQIRNEDAGMAILKKVEMLQSLTEKQMLVIARALTKKVYPSGTTLFTQGDIGEDFYMLAAGEVAITVNHVEVAKLKAGDYFGETSLLSSEKRNASAVTAGGGSADALSKDGTGDETVCLQLSRDDFNNLLGPLEAIMKVASDKRALEASNKGMAGLAKSFSASMKRLSVDREAKTEAGPPSFNDLVYIRTLGTGTFGVVKLAYHPATKKGYALKIMEKQTVTELHQEKGVFFERDLMKELEYVLLPTLYATYNDVDNLYMLLELLPGGEFWGILHEDVDLLGYNRLGGIDDDKAAFYSACVLAGLGHMHSMDICYRDMKPENMVLDSAGYIKIVDYGFCKKLPNNSTTNTMCGTPEYIPPEMVKSKPHTRAVDLWSFGVFLYELATRGTPFEHNDTSGIYRNIMAAPEKLKTAFKSNFPVEAKSIIGKLLVENPAMRIGMLRNGFDDIWDLPYYKAHGITKAALEAKTIRPPFIPEVSEVRVQDANNDDDEEQVPYTGKIDFSSF
jgi:CRP-like cAMP-binding protein